MIVRGLFEEMIRRRLWPIALAAVLVVVAAPLFFLNKGPNPDDPGVAGAQNVPAIPAAAGLPTRAERLVTNAERKPAKPKHKRKAADPFSAPKGVKVAAAADQPAAANQAPADSAKTSDSGPSKPIPVVITDAKGKTVGGSDSSSAGSGSSPGDSGSSGTSSSSTGAQVASVDVRYSKHGTRHVLHAIPRLKPFLAGGKLLATFVKYSTVRKAAVFAVSPGTTVSGVYCRFEDDVCRYVDIPAGDGARLKLITAEGQVITRKLDVEDVTFVPGASAGSAGDSAKDGACLLQKLLKLGLGDPPVTLDACA
jgi:hypothetical protein